MSLEKPQWFRDKAHFCQGSCFQHCSYPDVAEEGSQPQRSTDLNAIPADLARKVLLKFTSKLEKYYTRQKIRSAVRNTASTVNKVQNLLMAFILHLVQHTASQQNSQVLKTSIYASKAWKINLATHCSVSLGTRPLACPQCRTQRGAGGTRVATHTTQASGAQPQDSYRPPTPGEARATPG